MRIVSWVVLSASLASCSTTRLHPADGVFPPASVLASEVRSPLAAATGGGELRGPATTSWTRAATDAAGTETAATFDPPAPLPLLGGDSASYTLVKVAAFVPSGDISDLDTGFYGEVAFGHKFLAFLALEATLGYLQANGSIVDLWGIPAFLNARAQVPLLIFEVYGGAGVGGMYVDYSAGPFSNNDFVAAWDAFAGLQAGIGNLAVGAEFKYLQTSDTTDNFAVEGSIASLFVSLPF